jgi:type I restriction enzyme, S subunit
MLLPPVYKSISNGIRPDQWRIEPDKFLGLKVALPPVEVQDHILTFLERELSVHGQLAIEAESAIALLQERRSALISATVTGQIDVRTLASAEAEAA